VDETTSPFAAAWAAPEEPPIPIPGRLERPEPRPAPAPGANRPTASSSPLPPTTTPSSSSWPEDRALPGFPMAPPTAAFEPSAFAPGGATFGSDPYASGRFTPGPYDPQPALPSEEAPPARAPGTLRVALVAALVGALVAALVTAGAFVAFDDGNAQVASGSTARQIGDRGVDIRGLLEKAQPSVVSISTGQTTARGVYGGAGSGVIISADGLVLTNAHVIGGSTRVDVVLSDGSVESATLVGSSPDDDIALVRIDNPVDLIPAEIGRSADVVVGDDVVAIGNALNLGGPPSVTLGIVSAKGRTIEAPGGLVLRDLIQTDAAINPGNSGGPLLNADGQVVGINTAIIDDAQNIGFAIAVDAIAVLIEELRSGQGDITPDTAFLGVSMMDVRDVTASVRTEYGVAADDGAFVSDLVPGSAATDAGLELGDVIVAVDGAAVSGSDEVANAIRQRSAGESIDLTYERDGRRFETTATLKSRADSGG